MQNGQGLAAALLCEVIGTTGAQGQASHKYYAPPEVREMTAQFSARATMTVNSDLIQVRSRLWVPWARIALRHEVMAEAARQESQRSKVLTLERETDAGLVGICVTAFALERSLGSWRSWA